MLLAIDVGNSTISAGLFDRKRELKFLASIDTDSRKTADQISIDLMNLFQLYHYDLKDVTGSGTYTIPVRVYLDAAGSVGVIGDYSIVVSVTR